VAGPASDNFWTMGDTGPCGPCTEIFYDHGEEIAGGPPGSPDEDGDRFMEIWNNVFMQYDRQADGSLKPLPQTGVDTGMGLERLSTVLQGVHNNFHIDTFMAIHAATEKTTGVRYEKEGKLTPSFHVIADHMRTMSALIAEGVMPSNEGRGYVLRRIMRRAMRHGQLLGMAKPFLYNIVPTVVETLRSSYPELARAERMVMDTVKAEEERFGKTLSTGMKYLEQELKNTKGKVLSGEAAFKLYDTYGFPLDLTQDILRSSEMTVDTDGFETAMNEQRARARAAGMGGAAGEKLAPVWFDLRDRLPATEFLGYAKTQAEGQILALLDEKLSEVKELPAGAKGFVVVNQTPFYAESGGQVGDEGELADDNGVLALVTDTQKILGGVLFSHAVTAKKSLKVGQGVTLKVDAVRRQKIKRNHSSAHLFHAAVKKVLGAHVFQKGSLVDAQRMRFDFSHGKAMTAEEVRAVETQVNEWILANVPVRTQLMDKEAAIEAGAEALFGEKYDSEVRVLTMGEEGAKPFSVELCGGVHVSRTGDIGLFKIISESAIAAGVRRVEAATGDNALAVLTASEDALKAVANELKVRPQEVQERVALLQVSVKQLEKDLKKAKSGAIDTGAMVAKAEQVGKVSYLATEVVDVDAEELRELTNTLKQKLGSGVVLLATRQGDKATLVAGVTADLVSSFKASDVVNAAAAVIGGKGGGKPDLAMAGGKSPETLNEVFSAGRRVVAG